MKKNEHIKRWGEKPYYSLDYYLKKTFGEKIYKVALDGGMSCPNRDGTLGNGGCIFCSAGGSGDFAGNSRDSITTQIKIQADRLREKRGAKKFIAYFQNYTNTFMPLSDFQNYMKEAASQRDIIEISISTRPDCIRKDYMEVLKQIKETYSVEITLELGLQTVNYHTLDDIQRGHGLAEYLDAVRCIQMYDFTIFREIREEMLLKLQKSYLPFAYRL